MAKLPAHLAKYAFKKGSGPVTAKQAKIIASGIGKKKMPVAPEMENAAEDMAENGKEE